MTTVPPHDLVAEEALLGAVLLSDIAIPRLLVDLHLTAGAFYRAFHGQVWSAMVALHEEAERVDTVTLRARLEAHGVPSEKAKMVDGLPGAVPSASNVLSYARTVLELSEWRAIQLGAVTMLESVEARDRDLRQRAEGMLTSVRRPSSDTYSPEALAEEVWAHLSAESTPSRPTPYPKLNRALGGGFKPGEVTLLGGWTSHGKSVTADQLLMHFAAQGASTHLYINEMSPRARALRIVASLAPVDLSKLSQPSRLSEDDHRKITKTLGSLPFGITQVTDWRAEDVARDMRFRHWDICVLDLLHRLPFREERELAQISSVLNAAAQASGAHLIAVVHLNEERAKLATLPRPVLRDIRGSGMLKNDADNVLFIHREEEERDDAVIRTDEAALYLTKCRNGYTDGVKLTFDGQHTRFVQADPPAPATSSASEWYG